MARSRYAIPEPKTDDEIAAEEEEARLVAAALQESLASAIRYAIDEAPHYPVGMPKIPSRTMLSFDELIVTAAANHVKFAVAGDHLVVLAQDQAEVRTFAFGQYDGPGKDLSGLLGGTFRTDQLRQIVTNADRLAPLVKEWIAKDKKTPKAHIGSGEACDVGPDGLYLPLDHIEI